MLLYYDTVKYYCCVVRVRVCSSMEGNKFNEATLLLGTCGTLYVSVPSDEPVAHGKRSRRSSYSQHGDSIIAGPSHDLRQPSCVPPAAGTQQILSQLVPFTQTPLNMK